MDADGYYSGVNLGGWTDSPVAHMRTCLDECSARSDCVAALMYKNQRCWLRGTKSGVWTQYGGYRYMTKVDCAAEQPPVPGQDALSCGYAGCDRAIVDPILAKEEVWVREVEEGLEVESKSRNCRLVH